MRPRPKPPMTPYNIINIGTLTLNTDKLNAANAMMLPKKNKKELNGGE